MLRHTWEWNFIGANRVLCKSRWEDSVPLQHVTYMQRQWHIHPNKPKSPSAGMIWTLSSKHTHTHRGLRGRVWDSCRLRGGGGVYIYIYEDGGMCVVYRWRRLSGWRSGGGGGVGGSPTILSIYKKGAYKNVQGDSSVSPKHQNSDPSASSTWRLRQDYRLSFFFSFVLFLSTIENMLFL